MKRSGNHGLTNLIRNSNKECIHIYNVSNFNDFKIFKNKEIDKYYIDNKFTGFKDSKLTIISIEDKILQTPNCLGFRNLSVYLIRHPYNMLASMYKYNPSIHNLKNYVKLWKEFVCKVLDNINMTKARAGETKDRLVIIIYDKFYNNKDYRNKIISQLGVNYNPEFLNDKSGWAQSSFNSKTSFLDNEFNRYMYYINNSEFKEIVLDDTELMELYNKIYIRT